jgi:hypothetical protein
MRVAERIEGSAFLSADVASLRVTAYLHVNESTVLSNLLGL